MTLKMTDNQ